MAQRNIDSGKRLREDLLQKKRERSLVYSKVSKL